MKRGILLLLGALLLAAGVLAARQLAEPPFPHAAHETVFPVCEGCHVGVITGVEAELYPPPEACVECHDGTREEIERVEWTTPGPRASNLDFDHPDHVGLVDLAGDTLTCVGCHATPDVPASRMSVGAPQPDLCLGCHVAHPGETHVDVAQGAVCTDCHIPLTEAVRVPVERIDTFPRPASHEEPDFILAHEPETELENFSCAVCHARNTCERCHLNAADLEPVTALGFDSRVALLERDEVPEYPLPETHLQPAWAWSHGETTLDDPATCANCHTRPSCTACHLQGAGRTGAIGNMPLPTPERPRGVEIPRAAERVHPVDFPRAHGTWAVTATLQCAECHAESYCADCHEGQDSRAFHPLNFMERHAVEVFSGSADCQSCHSTEAFCRDCHIAVGVASSGAMNLAFHDAEPLWILAHGEAGRTNLESCAACHSQTDCLACHSGVGGWGVSPHGPAFDASRVAARNQLTCQWCHLGDPLGM